MRTRYGSALLGHVGTTDASAPRVPLTFPNPQPWTEDALCAQVDPELFFPEQGMSTLAAKRLCLRCPVIADCLEFALRTDEYGVWGGTSQHERKDMQAARRRAAAS